MKGTLITAGLALLVAAPVALHGQDSEWNRYTLEEIGGVYVSTEANSVCEAIGVTAASVEADAAVKLLEGEVDLLTEEEMLANPGLPELHITLACVEGGADQVAFSVDIRVQQAAQMIRDNQVTLAEAVTWYTSEMGVAAEGSADGALKGALDARLTQFAEAYVAANATEDRGSN